MGPRTQRCRCPIALRSEANVQAHPRSTRSLLADRAERGKPLKFLLKLTEQIKLTFKNLIVAAGQLEARAMCFRSPGDCRSRPTLNARKYLRTEGELS